MIKAINLKEKLATFDDLWGPRVVGDYNGNDLIVVKIKGEFIWHSHPETDDFFMVLSGQVTIETENGNVEVNPGEIYVVPKGVQHRPVAQEETHLLLIEPAGTPNTGDPKTAVAKPRI
jgi:mannose-6-phosphate isomerase-like protein (cupin superfamily)